MLFEERLFRLRTAGGEPENEKLIFQKININNYFK